MKEVVAVSTPSWSHKGWLKPLYSIRDLGDRLEILIDLPSADEASIEVRASGRRVSISARLRKETVFSDWSGRGGEVVFTEFRDEIILPTDVNEKPLTVDVRRGIVRVIFKKAEA